MDSSAGILLLIIGALLYFLPSIIGKNKRNAGAIFALNFFLGWTLIGWVVSLVWALTVDDPNTAVTNTAAEPQVTQTWTCSTCRAPVNWSHKFCPQCGQPLNWPS